MTAFPTTYAIRVQGHLDDHWSGWLGGLAMTRDDDGGTTVTVPAADQAQLHGVLAGLRDIGAVISELRVAPVCASILGRPLRTDRLILRPAAAGDADPTWGYRRLQSVNEWLIDCPPSRDAHRELFADPPRLATAVIVTLGRDAAGPVIGDFALRRHGAQIELGWVFDPAHSGHGYSTEALCELLRHCFGDLGVRRVTASCFLEDDTSWRLMERVGMRRELHAVRGSLHRSGRWLDTVGYAVLDDEWAFDPAMRPQQAGRE